VYSNIDNNIIALTTDHNAVVQPIGQLVSRNVCSRTGLVMRVMSDTDTIFFFDEINPVHQLGVNLADTRDHDSIDEE